MIKQTLSALYVLCSLSVASAAPATHYVNNGSVAGNCPGQYSTIQAAVNASAPGDTVLVCNGVYNEQVTISQSLTLNGQSGATIQPSNAVVNGTDPDVGEPVVAIVYVNGASNVTVSGLIIDGSLSNVNLACSPEFYGIFYSNSSGTIEHNTVRFIEQNGNLFGCQTGLAINAGNSTGASNSLTIQANSVHDFQKNGITVSDTGLSTTITGNTIVGVGPNALNAQNGIQLGYGATGTISANEVSGLIYTACPDVPDCTYATTGILIYDSAGITITGNSVQQTQGAIYAESDDGSPLNETITSNKLSNTLVFDGVGVYGDGSKISGNNIVNSSESGVNIIGNNNQVASNVVVESPIGVLISFGIGTKVSGEKNFGVPQQVVTAPPAPARLARQPVHRQ